MTLSSPHSRTALVLGGGGAAGNAWLIGLIAGLLESGADVTRPDLIVGTSAGSTTAAQITGADAAELYAATVAAVVPPRVGSAARPGARHLELTDAVIAGSTGIADMRRRMGATLAEDAASDRSPWWRTTVAARLPVDTWPQQPLRITAVDADTGEPVVFDRDSGVDLIDAVAASCAGGFAYRIGDRRYIDGGFRANPDNADLAAGYERVLVLSPLGGRSRFPAEWGARLADQVAVLRADGSEVETVYPDAAALAAFGDDLMDYSTRPAAARAGQDQGIGLAGDLRAFLI